MELDELLDAVDKHMQEIEIAARDRPQIQAELAKAIAGTLQTASVQWESLSSDARHWIGGAMQYFSHGDDEEPDLISPIGFEDDAAVVNTCLRCAGLEHLCVDLK